MATFHLDYATRAAERFWYAIGTCESTVTLMQTDKRVRECYTQAAAALSE